jgi:hypothetical protein
MGCWPASVNTMDAAARRGCTAHSAFSICVTPLTATTLPDGAVVAPDGGPAGDVCSSACGVDEFAIMCQAARPDRALRCAQLPLSSVAAFFCCPCPTSAP